jgi:trans-aconitate methyltransferase
VKSKLRTDPVYAAVTEVLLSQREPLYDIGCGVGLLAFYLRERGYAAPITGVDHDSAKVRAAAKIGARYGGLTFAVGDARAQLPQNRNVAVLDVLHYFRDEERRDLLEAIADAVAPGGVAIIRECIRDTSLRFRVTAAQEVLSRAIRWMKAERLNFATREEVVAPFAERGFSVTVTPMWGRTPFNNYMFVFRRAASGITNS